MRDCEDDSSAVVIEKADVQGIIVQIILGGRWVIFIAADFAVFFAGMI